MDFLHKAQVGLSLPHVNANGIEKQGAIGQWLCHELSHLVGQETNCFVIEMGFLCRWF